MPLTTASDVVRRLEARGDVRRRPNPDDGRSSLFELTPPATANGGAAGGAAAHQRGARASELDDDRTGRAPRSTSSALPSRAALTRRLIRIRSICSGSGLSSRRCAPSLSLCSAAASSRRSPPARRRADRRREDQGRRRASRPAPPPRRRLRLGERVRLARTCSEDQPEDEQGRLEDRTSASARAGSAYGAGSLWVEDTSSNTISRVSLAHGKRAEGDRRRRPRPTTRPSPTAPPGRPPTAAASSNASTRPRTASSSASRCRARPASSARSGRSGRPAATA